MLIPEKLSWNGEQVNDGEDEPGDVQAVPTAPTSVMVQVVLWPRWQNSTIGVGVLARQAPKVTDPSHWSVAAL